MNLEKTVQDWRATAEGDGLHDKLMGVAVKAYQERPECRTVEGLEDYLKSLMAARWGTVDATGERDCHNTAVHAVESSQAYKAKEERIKATAAKAKADYTAERKEWYDLNGTRPALLDEVLKQDVRDDRISMRTALNAIFQNASGHIWHGATESVIEANNWVDASAIATIPYGSNYVSICTFGDKVKEGEAETIYERTNDNVSKIVAVLLEMDAPMTGKHYTKDELAAMPLNEKKSYRERILLDTCLILERAGLKPTTMTFSGNKSYHVLIRLAEPVDALKWHSRLKDLRDAYRIIGADEKVLTLSRCTRMPRGCRKDEAMAGDCQRLVYFDPTAEMTLDDVADKIKAFAAQISEVKEDPANIHCPVFSEVNAKGETKWHKNCEEWGEFVEKARITKIDAGDKQKLIVSDERGIYEERTPAQVGDYLAKYVAIAKGRKTAAHFVDLYGATLAKASLEVYTGIVRPLNETHDTRAAVYAPFRNGLLTITADGIDLTPDYCGHDVRRDAPTIRRDFQYDATQGEFEVFIERVCGKMEGSPLWRERKKSIVTMLGYMVCQWKEALNYLNILTEESMGEDSGRTGKSLIAGCVKHWRKRCYIDAKQISDETKRFMLSSLTDADHYVQFDDVRKNHDWEHFYNFATADWNVERKYENGKPIPKEDAPKMIFTSNFYPRANGGSQAGRMRIIEISNHYSATHTPEDEFGHRFFDEWGEEEWQRFDTFIARCVSTYLKHGYHAFKSENQTYKEYAATVPEYIKDWFEDAEGLFAILKMEHSGGDLEKEYRDWYFGKYHAHSPKQFPTPQKISDYIKQYCAANGLDVFHGNVKRAGGVKKVWKFKATADASWELVADKGSGGSGQVTDDFSNSVTPVTTENKEITITGYRVADKYPPSSIEKEKENIYILEREESSVTPLPQALEDEKNEVFLRDSPEFQVSEEVTELKNDSVTSATNSVTSATNSVTSATNSVTSATNSVTSATNSVTSATSSATPDVVVDLEERLVREGYIIGAALRNRDGLYVEYCRPCRQDEEPRWCWQKEGEGIEHEGLLEDAIDVPF